MMFRFQALWIFAIVFTKVLFAPGFCSPKHTFGGYFEVQIKEIRNAAGEQSEGRCCDEPRDSNGKCDLNPCDTFVHICLKEYHSSATGDSNCVFGSGQSPVLGGNVVVIRDLDNIYNKGRIRINLLSTWMRTFTIVIKIKDLDNGTDAERSGVEEELIDFDSRQDMLSPARGWFERNYVGSKAHISYRMRMACYPHYYGFNCTIFCKPRSDFLGHYTCDVNGNKKCIDGWMGKDCKKPICRIGCNAENGSCDQPYECKCTNGWQGELCNECKTYWNCDHGTCKDALDCNCDKNWTGMRCQYNTDYCGTHHPCMNGGMCTNPGYDQFHCECPEGYSGERCETAEYACISSPCQNGATCHNKKVNDFFCDCPPGWTGTTCEIDIDDCASSPCLHNGTCTDHFNSYSCSCPLHWEGHRCQLDADECKDSPCVHANECVNLIGNYNCHCEPGWEGKNCDIDIDDCAGGDVCYHGGTCEDQVDGFHCHCSTGYTGKRCKININDCANEPCMHGGQCIDKVGYYHCICPSGYSGKHCELNQGYCEPNPCENGALCFNLNNDYYCNCSDRYVGKNCSELKNECAGNNGKCEVIDSCQTRVPSNTSDGYELQLSTICGEHGTCRPKPPQPTNDPNAPDGAGLSYECECDEGYEGYHCELNINNCVENLCLNGATCIDGDNSYTCLCQDGFEGRNCETDRDDCKLFPCHERGECTDLQDDFMCKCRENWKGKTCNSRTDHCDEQPCKNNGHCRPVDNSYKCECRKGWTGPSCSKRTITPCSSNPCNNGGTCINEGDDFSCFCRDGFTGTLCEQNNDDCNPYPCYNRGKCVDGVNHYTCECLPGFTGPDCRINIDECASSPCAYGSKCVDGVHDYTCKCPATRTGKNCEKVKAPRLGCYSLTDGRIHHNGEEWNEVCNKCKCDRGELSCTKFWCGPRICLTPKESIKCPSDLICMERTSPHCFTPPCQKRSVCLHPHDSFPTGGGNFLPETVLKCIPNAQVLPSRNCRSIQLKIEGDNLSPGRYLEDVCAEIRNRSEVEPFAQINTLFIRCEKSVEKPGLVIITFSSNTTDPLDMTAINAAESLRNSAYHWITDNENLTYDDDSEYIVPLICVIVAIILCVIFAIFVVRHYHLKKRRGKSYREGTRVSSSSNSSVREDEKSFTNCDYDTEVRVVGGSSEDCEMIQFKKRPELLSVSMSSGGDRSKKTECPKQDKKMEKRVREAGVGKSSRGGGGGRDVMVMEEPGDFSSLNVSVAQRVSLNLSTVVSCERAPNSNHHQVIPTTASFRATSNGQPLRLRTIEINNDDEVLEQDPSEGRYETSRLLSACVADSHTSSESCACDSVHHQRHHSLGDVADCPESEEVAHYMSREYGANPTMSTSNNMQQQQAATCHHNTTATTYNRIHPRCDRHHITRNRQATQQASSAVMPQQSRARYENVSMIGSGGGAMTSQSRHHRSSHRRHKNQQQQQQQPQQQIYYAEPPSVSSNRSPPNVVAGEARLPADDAELPPYESVIVEAAPRGAPTHDPSCDCCARHTRSGRSRNSAVTALMHHPVAVVSSSPNAAVVLPSCHHHQSPPPSYSRHCPQTSPPSSSSSSTTSWRAGDPSTLTSSSSVQQSNNNGGGVVVHGGGSDFYQERSAGRHRQPRSTSDTVVNGGHDSFNSSHELNV